MGLIFHRGTTQTLWANFLSGSGEEAGTVSDAKITIRHYDATTGLVVTDIDQAAMTLGEETLYYYRWNIPSTAQEGNYIVEYEGVVDSVSIESTQEVYVSFTVLDSTGTAYTTQAMVAGMLGIDESAVDMNWIYWATEFIDTYTCRSWNAQTVTEKFDIEDTNTNALKLEKYPIISVEYVKDDGVTLGTGEYLIYNDIGMIKLPEDTYLSSSIFSSGYFTQGRQKVEVRYSFGDTAIPYDIQLAATMLAAKFGKISTGPTAADVTEKEIGDTRIRYAAQSSPSQGGAIGMTVQKILDEILSKYKCRDSFVV